MPWNRRKERETAFQMLFAARFFPESDPKELYEVLIGEIEEEEAKKSEYIQATFFGAREYEPTALEKIRANAHGWKIERFSKVTLTILLLAIYEMDCREDIPDKIAINEAVELAKKFDDDGAPKFINGILGAVARAS